MELGLHTIGLLEALGIIAATIFTFFSIRLTQCLPSYRKVQRKERGRKSGGIAAMVVFGSGGHTTEMIKLIKGLDGKKFTEFQFVLAQSDSSSTGKIASSKLSFIDKAKWFRIYRSREVKQSWFTTIGTTFRSMIDSFILVAKLRPALILCNGPGTCVPICLSAFLLRLLYVYEPKIIFTESFCRVKSLSLSGKILYPFADRFIVQWPELADKFSRAEYIGQIC